MLRKNVTTLMTGTLIAQVVPVLMGPLLTRIYSPQEFGQYALFVAISSILGVVASLRYELAIVQAKTEEDAASLFHLCLIINFSMFLVFCLSVFIYHMFDLGLFNHQLDNWSLLLLPFSFLLMGVAQTLRNWFLRKSNYGSLSLLSVLESLSKGVGQLGLGYIGKWPGLVFGQLLGQLAGCIYAFRKILKSDTGLFKRIDREQIVLNAVMYSDMPKYSTLGALSNSLSSQLPILAFSHLFVGETVGLFSLTIGVLAMPLSALSSALSQVLLKQFSHYRMASPEKIKPLILKIVFGLIILMIPFISIFRSFGGDIFSLVFGEQWSVSGQMSRVLVFAVAVRFIVSPLSVVLALAGNVKSGTIWQVVYLCTLSITLYFSRSLPIDDVLVVYVIHETILYSLYFSLIMKGVSRIEKGL